MNIYYHPMFQRGREDLLLKIQRLPFHGQEINIQKPPSDIENVQSSLSSLHLASEIMNDVPSDSIINNLPQTDFMANFSISQLSSSSLSVLPYDDRSDQPSASVAPSASYDSKDQSIGSVDFKKISFPRRLDSFREDLLSRSEKTSRKEQAEDEEEETATDENPAK